MGGRARGSARRRTCNACRPLDLAVADGDRFESAGERRVTVLDVSGHTVGHIAFPRAGREGRVHCRQSSWLLAAGAYSRVQWDQMWASLGKIAELPGDTTILFGARIHRVERTLCDHHRAGQPGASGAQSRESPKRAPKGETDPCLRFCRRSLRPIRFLRAGIAENQVGTWHERGQAMQRCFGEIRRRKGRVFEVCE